MGVRTVMNDGTFMTWETRLLAAFGEARSGSSAVLGISRLRMHLAVRAAGSARGSKLPSKETYVIGADRPAC